jgi:4-hydroxy-4-methyl-2-oxoglutarate aldolase
MSSINGRHASAATQELSREELLVTPHDIPSPYNVPVHDLVMRFEKLYTAALIDIFQEMDLHNQWLGPAVKCLTRDLKRESIAGYAFTVQWIFDPLPDERERPAAKMVGSYPKDSIIVVDTGADQVSGFWGELATTTCVHNGVCGAVINGGAKDIGFVREIGFPVFAKFSSPVDGFHYSRLRGWQLPIWFGNVLIRPWDFLLCDADGVLVIPAEVVEVVLARAEERRDSENRTRSLLKDGMHPDQATKISGRRDL